MNEILNFKASIEKCHEIKRLIIISDTHFGVRSNSVEWIEIQSDYFFKWLIPLLQKIQRPGDALIHTGDVFDSRQTINLRVMNMAMEIFEEISKIMPVLMICGNHDIYYKTSNSINSIKVFKWFPRIKVYEEPVILEVAKGQTKILLMPWRESQKSEFLTIQTNPADYLFCHTDIRGLKFNHRAEIEEGNDIQIYQNFKRVYSGHIHFAQKFHNVRMVGCPYPLTRSDLGNPKHVWILDLENDIEENIENTFSPKFIRLKLENVLETTYEQMKQYLSNNFVDILVSSKWAAKFPFASFLEAFDQVNYRKLNYIFTTRETEDEIDLVTEKKSYEVDLVTLIDNYIDNLSYQDTIKQKLKEVARTLYQKSLKSDSDEIIA